jgi:hypothetical protein
LRVITGEDFHMTKPDDTELLRLTRELLDHLCEELQLNCTRGKIDAEAPMAALAVKRASRLLNAVGCTLPLSAIAVMMDVTTGPLPVH